jgi:hypothetical protein
MYKYRHLARPNDKLGTILDFILVPWKTPRNCVPRVVNPFNNVDEFISQHVKQAHLLTPGRRDSKASRRQIAAKRQYSTAVFTVKCRDGNARLYCGQLFPPKYAMGII